MKLTVSCFTIFIIVITVDCGLVKQFFGNVKEDVHTVVDGTVSVIGKGTHKITEGLGVFLHRNEGNKFPGPTTEAAATSNQITNDNKLDENKYNEDKNNVQEENTSVHENHAHYNYVQSTPATTVEHPKTKDTSNSNNNVYVPKNIYSKPTTESNSKYHEDSNNNVIIHDHTVVPTADINDVTTTETSWLNGAELENILPTIAHNETHFTGNTNELDSGENIRNNTGIKESNKPTVKCDDDKKVNSHNGNKANLVSDQLFFNDNKPKPTEAKNYVCAEGLVRTANGECLKQIEIDVSKKVEPLVSNVFQADGCASGYARALDGSCQKIIG